MHGNENTFHVSRECGCVRVGRKIFRRGSIWTECECGMKADATCDGRGTTTTLTHTPHTRRLCMSKIVVILGPTVNSCASNDHRNGFPFVTHVCRFACVACVACSRSSLVPCIINFVFTVAQWPMSKLRTHTHSVRAAAICISHFSIHMRRISAAVTTHQHCRYATTVPPPPLPKLPC